MIFNWRRTNVQYDNGRAKELGIVAWWYALSESGELSSCVEVRKSGIFIASGTWNRHNEEEIIGPYETEEDAKQALETMINLGQEPKWGRS